ncbi:hypothetical protein MM239_05970 [Belliella sp. DSM 111904]|uniref:Phage protein n=1 Tax=Belliella filtrata TaxID=2923435 RepID=A0ABS9UXQ4_9BACT|nr:hypothetical protein [Belliella filtrata]MCH7408932.1 hypothetical protein [Belliella filtrata]
MKPVRFKYKEQPGDLFRNTDIVPLPNPQEDLEGFLVQFLKNYQSDKRVTYMDDLYKLLHNDFINEADKQQFIIATGIKTDRETETEIQKIENELISEAYSNFYHFVLTKQIEIIANSNG